MSWRTTASHPEPATEGREGTEDGDPAAQAERDLHWQQRLHAERLAHGVSAEDEANYVGRPEGPAAGVAAELRRIHPSGLRQVSPRVERRVAAHGWSLEHIGVTIGTVVHGPRLAETMSAEPIETLYSVLLERKVIFFRGQQGLTEAQHIAFAEQFGSTEVFPFSVREGAAPSVMPLKSVGPIAGGASGWHSDVTWRGSPSLGSLLYCETAPAFGGSTGFVDCYASWQGLTSAQRAALRGKNCVHDFDTFRDGQRESGVSEATIEEMRRDYPVARHPIVRTHPDTGGEMLYVNPLFGRFVEEEPGKPMAEDASDELLRRLYDQANVPEFQCFFRYDSGSLAFWDNRSCMHRASVDFSPHQRIMRRVTVQGASAPYYDPGAAGVVGRGSGAAKL